MRKTWENVYSFINWLSSKKEYEIMKGKIPDWMQVKEPLENKKIYEFLVEISKFVTDPAVQAIYEYIQDLEKANHKLINKVDFLKEQINDLRKIIGKGGK